MRTFIGALTIACLLGGCEEESVGPPDLAAVARLTITPDSLTLLPGGSGVFAAVVRDSGGNVMRGVPVIWSGSNSRMSIDSNGRVVVGLQVVRREISALVMHDGFPVATDYALVKVVGPFSVLTLNTPTYEPIQGDTITLIPFFSDSALNPYPAVPLTWSSSDTARATVSSAGAVHAKQLGSVTIRATTGTVSGATSLTVVAGPATYGGVPVRSARAAAVGSRLTFRYATVLHSITHGRGTYRATRGTRARSARD